VYKYTVSQKTSRLRLAITLTYVNGFPYFLSEILQMKCAIKRCFTTPLQTTCASAKSALPDKTGKNENTIFHSNAALVHCQNSTCCCLISSISLTHNSYSLCCIWLPKSCNRCTQLGAVEGMVQEKGNQQHYSSWTVLCA